MIQNWLVGKEQYDSRYLMWLRAVNRGNQGLCHRIRGLESWSRYQDSKQYKLLMASGINNMWIDGDLGLFDNLNCHLIMSKSATLESQCRVLTTDLVTFPIKPGIVLCTCMCGTYLFILVYRRMPDCVRPIC